MSKIFYLGEDNKVYGPVTEVVAQGWYASGYLSSDVKFQISVSDRFDPKERLLSLGELIESNGRSLPFYFSPEKENREKQLEDTINKLKQEVESLRITFTENQSKSKSVINEKINVLQSQVASLRESNTDILQKLNVRCNKREASTDISLLEKNAHETKKKVDEQEKKLTAVKKEISALNSNFDKANSKIMKLIESKEEVDESVNGYNRTIAELLSSEKSIQDRITSCEQNAQSTASELQTMQTDIYELKNAVQELKNDSFAQREILSSATRDIAAVLAAEEERRMAVRSIMPSQSTSDGTADGENIPPWDKKIFSNIESQRDEFVPWENGKNDNLHVSMHEKTDSGTKDIVESEMTMQETSVEQIKIKDESVVLSNSECTAAPTKPISRMKDWSAICRDLSDDEEETATSKNEQTVRAAEDFVRDFIRLLRMYCTGLDTPDYESLKLDSFHIGVMELYVSACQSTPIKYEWIKDALKEEMRRLTLTPIVCSVCLINIMTPRHMLLHFVDARHADRSSSMPAHCRSVFNQMTRLISTTFNRFIASNYKIREMLMQELSLLTQQGAELMKKTPQDDMRIRPTPEFKQIFSEKIMQGALDKVNDYPGGAYSMPKKDVAVFVRNWLAESGNKQQLETEIREHLRDGILCCYPCATSFDDIEKYFQHITTYAHISLDKSGFAHSFMMFKGLDYWDAML